MFESVLPHHKKGAVKKVPKKEQAAPEGAACKNYKETADPSSGISRFVVSYSCYTNENYRYELYTNPAEIASGFGKNY